MTACIRSVAPSVNTKMWCLLDRYAVPITRHSGEKPSVTYGHSSLEQFPSVRLVYSPTQTTGARSQGGPRPARGEVTRAGGPGAGAAPALRAESTLTGGTSVGLGPMSRDIGQG